jgi:hypothetical protein
MRQIGPGQNEECKHGWRKAHCLKCPDSRRSIEAIERRERNEEKARMRKEKEEEERGRKREREEPDHRRKEEEGRQQKMRRTKENQKRRGEKHGDHWVYEVSDDEGDKREEGATTRTLTGEPETREGEERRKRKQHRDELEMHMVQSKSRELSAQPGTRIMFQMPPLHKYHHDGAP